MNISFDIDNVLVDTTQIYKSVFRDSNLKYENPKTYWFSNYTRKIRKEIYKRLNSAKYMLNLELFDGIQTIINELSKEHDIYILTSRHKELIYQTASWIQEKLPCIKQILVSNSKPKSEFIEEFDISMHFEDNPLDIIEISMNTDCIIQMISNADTTYNHFLRHEFCYWESIVEFWKKYKNNLY